MLLFWVLLFLRDQYFDDSAGKLKDIKYWVLRGCSSPYLYIEAYYLISQDPYLIKELSVFELRILSWAVKEKALTKELAGAILRRLIWQAGSITEYMSFLQQPMRYVRRQSMSASYAAT